MKTVFRFLTLLLCFELVIGPMNSNLSLIGQEAFAETCAKGMSFDSTLNRCLTTAETANVMNATASCAQGDVECYKTNAQNAFQDKVNKGDAPERKDSGGFVSSVAGVAAVAGPVSIAAIVIANNSSQCVSTSFWTMVGASAALLIGDTLANMQHKKRLSKIKDDWGKIVNPEDVSNDKDLVRQRSSEAQSQAFEMLARSEDSLVSAAKMKRNFFLIAGAAYAASAILAYTEISHEAGTLGVSKALTTCTPIPKPPGVWVNADQKFNNKIRNQFIYNLKNSKDISSFMMNQKALSNTMQSPSLDEYLTMKKALKKSTTIESAFPDFKNIMITILQNINPIDAAMAQSDSVNSNAAKAYKEDSGKSSSILKSLGIGAAVGLAALAASPEIQAKMIETSSRAIFSGVMSGMSFLMASHAGSQAEASQKRADLLRKMRDDFVSASSALNTCKSEDRNDPSKPTCYCYTPDNQRNTNRTSSQVCQKLWSGINPGSPLADNNTSSDKICITKTNLPDPSCSCKTTNTCMKVSISNLPGLSSGTASMLASSVAPLNAIANGTASGANIDSGKLASQAMQMQSALKQLATNKATKDLIPNKDKQEAKLMADLNKASSGMAAGNMLGSTGSSAMPSNPSQAAAMLEKELDDKKSTTTSSESLSETVVAPSSNQKSETLEFGLTTDQAAAQETQIAEVMKKDLDYGGNDINQGSKTNIFEVLSNRYQRSGMRRLFDEKGKTQAEKAATTDINQ